MSAIGTICIPTYNRGARLLSMLKEVLPEVNDFWPILISDNASTSELQEYKEVAGIAARHKNVHYSRHSKNLRFEGNLLSFFENVSTQYIVVISDEDFPCMDGLNSLVPLLSKHRDIGAIRSSMENTRNGKRSKYSQAVLWEDRTFLPADCISIQLFGMVGNYISGSIYNVPLLNKFRIPSRLRANLMANQAYPHLYLNLLAAANTKTMRTKNVTCFMGEQDQYEPELMTNYFGGFSYGARVDQFIALRDALFEGYKDIQGENKGNSFDSEGFYKSYVSLCAKFFQLVLFTNGQMYNGHLLNLNNLRVSFTLLCISAIQHFPDYDTYKNWLTYNITNNGLIQLAKTDKSVQPLPLQ